MPLQSEIRTLLHEYLNDQDRGSASSRNPISSINEVLREGRFGRDRLKVSNSYYIENLSLSLSDYDYRMSIDSAILMRHSLTNF